MALPQMNGQLGLNLERVWYDGTVTLRRGFVMCFVHNATKNNADPKLRLGRQVTQPATANLSLFAGIVAEESDGVTGPCWVTLVRPGIGQACDALVVVNATVATTPLQPVNGAWSLGTATFGIATIAVAGETEDTSAQDITTPAGYAAALNTIILK